MFVALTTEFIIRLQKIAKTFKISKNQFKIINQFNLEKKKHLELLLKKVLLNVLKNNLIISDK